jgi:hypothetical protein
VVPKRGPTCHNQDAQCQLYAPFGVVKAMPREDFGKRSSVRCRRIMRDEASVVAICDEASQGGRQHADLRRHLGWMDLSQHTSLVAEDHAGTPWRRGLLAKGGSAARLAVCRYSDNVDADTRKSSLLLHHVAHAQARRLSRLEPSSPNRLQTRAHGESGPWNCGTSYVRRCVLRTRDMRKNTHI